MVGGTRMLESTYGLDRVQIPDPKTPGRLWRVQGLYLPVHGRALGGLRAKLEDQKGFITFCNQRDLEVILGLGAPGQYCPWSGRTTWGRKIRTGSASARTMTTWRMISTIESSF